MTPRDILTVVTSSAQESALAAAELLAKRWQTHTTVLQLCPLPDAVLAADPVGAGLWAQALEQARTLAAEDKVRLERRLAAFVTPTEVRAGEGAGAMLDEAVAMSARHADLTVMERPRDNIGIAAFEAALFQSGRPVLLTPPGWSGVAIGKRVMIAWSAKREAARALADAAPFLDAAEKITVVAVDASTFYTGDKFTGYDISTHLAREGLDVSLRQVDSVGRTAEAALLDEARDLDADLIVMGGYGHARFSEFVFGGVTRALLGACPVPILMSH
ncbi:universal stress protein [Terricaulis sp.]|uniref:universal stress protein n=1 Tax=Terricaulis sp. TaxID=2768686 RepID=UPI003784E728